MSDKSELRARYLRLRAACKTEELDKLVTQQAIRSPFFAAERIFIYCSVKSEAATGELIARLLAEGRQVCVPQIRGGVMRSVPYAPLVRDAFGIPAPRGGDDTACDVAFVPLLAVDGRGVRLGYGGGYYDAYFARHPHTLRVGLAYGVQLADRLPCDAWDVPLHAVVTERGVTTFAGRALDSGAPHGL